MNRQIPPPLSAILLMAFTGCNPPVEIPVVQQPIIVVVNAPQAKVWNAIISTVGIEYPIQAIERDSGLISTRPVAMLLPANRWALGCDKAKDFAYPWNQLRMDMRVLVEERQGGQTQITILCHYEAFKESTYPRAWTVMASSGALENEILQNVQQRLLIQFDK